MFLNIHIRFHRKINDEIDYMDMEESITGNKDNFDKLCNIRLPMKFTNDIIPEIIGLSFLDLNSSAGKADIMLTNMEEQKKDKPTIAVPLAIENALPLFDTEDTYVTDHNYDFVNSYFRDNIKRRDIFIRPRINISQRYDLMSGSIGAYTQTQYNIHHRSFYFVTSGEVKIRLLHPSNKKLLSTNNEYGKMEYKFLDNIWSMKLNDVNKKINKINYSTDLNGFDVIVKKGECIYIPPYWIYSILYSESHTTVLSCEYQTPMNVVSNIDKYILYGINKK